MTTLADLRTFESSYYLKSKFVNYFMDPDLAVVNTFLDAIPPLLEIAELAQMLVDYKGSDWDVFSHGIFAILKHRLTALERE